MSTSIQFWKNAYRTAGYLDASIVFLTNLQSRVDTHYQTPWANPILRKDWEASVKLEVLHTKAEVFLRGRDHAQFEC